jgi:hypothetical protein
MGMPNTEERYHRFLHDIDLEGIFCSPSQSDQQDNINKPPLPRELLYNLLDMQSKAQTQNLRQSTPPNTQNTPFLF